MDSERRSSFGSKESIDGQRRNSKDNTEYVPTRCRITKPIPPKPAANPMQFVKIGPCELFRKAQQQLKKVEEVKHVRQEIRDEAEDWQANLDNWKSSRRKRQEHIIERVVEVKKFEQQEQSGGRRKSKTFNEILEERNKRKTKLSISLYENDDPNDFSDYGIGMTSAINENAMHIDDNSNVEYDEQNSSTSYDDLQCKNNVYTSSSYESDNNTMQELNDRIDNFKLITTELLQDSSGTESGSGTTKNKEINLQDNEVIEKKEMLEKNAWHENYKQDYNAIPPEPEQYTYESAIQGYRTRVIAKTNVSPSLTSLSYGLETKLEIKPEDVIVSKGSNILKRKELFESDKLYELNHFESSTSRRLSDDFIHSQSLKQRLLSLEKFTEQPHSNTDSNKFSMENNPILMPIVASENASDIKNNNTCKLSADQFVRNRVSMFNNHRDSIPNEYEDNIKSKTVISSNWSNKTTGSERFSSPEPDVFVNKMDTMHHRSLDNLTDTTNESMPLGRIQSLEGLDYCHSNYPASNSSTELLILSSQYGDTDREDSGIHTADVSCSVSQADEPVEDPEITATVGYSCMQKSCINPEDTQVNTCVSSQSGEDSSVDGSIQLMSPISMENIDYINSNIYPMDFNFATEDFPLGPPVTALEPPKEKPPPPPVNDLSGEPDECELKRFNSTKRIKKEMRMKRSSFLGIDPDDQPELEASIRKPPDINSFLQKESRLEKQLYKKTQSSYSEAGDSQDSGIELERGRLSSDTWCSSLADSAGAAGIVHSRQNSEPYTTNSITSEEDEITKKEREIIELVEKEEKWRDTNEFVPADDFDKIDQLQTQNSKNAVLLPKNPSEQVNHQAVAEYATSEDDEHSEVLRVEYELLQLEREELKRQRENMVFRESHAHLQTKPCLKNKRLSLEDLNDTSNQPLTYTNMYQPDAIDYRKSMPELQIQREIVPIPTYNPRTQSSTILSRSTHVTPVKHPRSPIRESYDNTPIRKSNNVVEDDLYQRTNATTTKVSHPATRHSLQMLSATPRSRLIPQDTWIHPKPSAEPREKFNYNQHWLIQEAEQRRISEQQKYTTPPLVQSWKLTRSEKHLPDSVIQTLTQRVQNKINLSERNILGKKMDGVPGHYGSHSPHSVGHALPIHHPHLMMEESQDKMLSVSGKKKCSYCGNELGRGAAMIIESLSLFYHMDCFKCCVCHVQLGDGLMGTDVRVRNNKLHCHNCYSSDDGVKFSCV